MIQVHRHTKMGSRILAVRDAYLPSPLVFLPLVIPSEHLCVFANEELVKNGAKDMSRVSSSYKMVTHS